MTPLVNHLWQSTLFAAVIAVLAYAFRANRASTRHWLWTTASFKFLVPFSMLTGLGGGLAWHPATSVATIRPVAIAVSQASEVFVPVPATIPAPSYLPVVLTLLWAAGFLWTAISWGRSWWIMRKARHAAHPSGVTAAVPVLFTPILVEPGVFGIWRPILLLPEGIAAKLTPAQLDAILAHELCHVRRRDNLLAAIHMVVTAIFWFHPLVWWMGSRLEEERERACDEAVVGAGNAPEAYAEGILNVCTFYLQSPLPCAAGVTGADLKKRIRQIMNRRAASRLSFGRKALLAAAALAAVVAPIVSGVVQAQGPLAFDVASIRPANPEERNSRFHIAPGGGINVVNVPVRNLIEFAYDVRESQLIGGPGWIQNTAYDIVARVEKADGPTDLAKMTDGQRRTLESQIRQRTQALLADRFQLQVRRESRELPVLALTVAKGGMKVAALPSDDQRPPNIWMSRGTLTAQRVPLSEFAQSLSRLLRQTVVDQTGVAGDFKLEMKWSPDATPDSDGPSIYTAIQEQLGLRLESKKSTVDVLVIERVEKPTEN